MGIMGTSTRILSLRSFCIAKSLISSFAMSSLKVFAALILVLPSVLCFPNSGSSGSDVWTAEDEAAARERLRGGNLGRVVISGGQAGSSSSSGVRGSSSSSASRFGGSSGSSFTGFSTGSSSRSSSSRSSSHRASLNSALSGKKNQIRISQIMDRDSSNNGGFVTGKNTGPVNSSSERGCKSCHLVHAHAKAHSHGHAYVFVLDMII